MTETTYEAPAIADVVDDVEFDVCAMLLRVSNWDYQGG
jgi:hypothetical protein